METLKSIGNYFWGYKFQGPATNAPNNGENIKAIFDMRPKQVIIITEGEIQKQLTSLKKTVIPEKRPPKKAPIMEEFDQVFSGGYKEFFALKKQRREEKRLSSQDSQDSQE